MQTTVNQRIKILIDSLEKGNQSTFANKVGVGRATINNLIGGRMNDPSFAVLQKITEAYANVNLNWLMTGEGEMLKEQREGGRSYQLTGNNNTNAAVGERNKISAATDETLRKELEECRQELKEMRAKYIALLEKLAQ